MIAGIGTDIVVIADLRRSMERTPGFAQRVFTPAEQARCAADDDPWPVFAGMFAVKEAVMKALGTGWSEGVDFRDVEFLSVAALSGRAAERVSGIGGRVHASASATSTMAFAAAVLETS